MNDTGERWAYRIASQRLICSIGLISYVRYVLYCFFFFVGRLDFIAPDAYRTEDVAIATGARNFGILDIAVGLVNERLSLAIETRHWDVEAIVKVGGRAGWCKASSSIANGSVLQKKCRD